MCPGLGSNKNYKIGRIFLGFLGQKGQQIEFCPQVLSKKNMKQPSRDNFLSYLFLLVLYFQWFFVVVLFLVWSRLLTWTDGYSLLSLCGCLCLKEQRFIIVGRYHKSEVHFLGIKFLKNSDAALFCFMPKSGSVNVVFEFLFFDLKFLLALLFYFPPNISLTR